MKKAGMTKIKKLAAIASIAGAAMISAPASAFQIIGDIDMDLTSFGGGTVLDIESLDGNGLGYVIQEASGGGAVANGDRFYEVGYINYLTATDQDTLTQTNLATAGVLPNLTDSLFIFFELGGSINLAGNQYGNPAIPDYNFDRGKISLILDNDQAFNSADGQLLSEFVTNFNTELAAGTYTMPGAGVGDSDPAGVFNLDVLGVTELISLDFISGVAGGDVPNGFNIPGSQTNATFGVDMTWNSCVANVFFDAANNDLCNGANPNQSLATTFLSVTGITNGTLSNPALYLTNTGSNGQTTPMLVNTTIIGDTAQFGIPEPATLALLGAGLLGFAGASQKRRRNAK